MIHENQLSNIIQPGPAGTTWTKCKNLEKKFEYYFELKP